MDTTQNRKKKAAVSAVLFGAASIGLYTAVYMFANPMVQLFSKGGAYCLLPVSTVFLFSYVHGNFASNVWTALGIEASSSAQKQDKASATKRQDTRPRATLQA
ncbi:hypothetical protein [Halodesulfovibrio marinisediminis]|uniref:Uncharacterized protein n=1 Tax=Halodesulfovibrio marinisediminis DSM 17456 TaxID=1121457 RepID=A0A1N6DX89_9BACT|nr:hypothetical protein [Halodesulfovibrio marinisediminis]SIN75399.1 hypothetical protein SAMN02745161_0551 [Halodesulfovibrio marinisediminis DSM 17456]